MHLRGGKTLSERVESARGSSARPLADADLEQKLCDLVEYSGSKSDPALIGKAVWSIDETQDAGAIIGLAAH